MRRIYLLLLLLLCCLGVVGQTQIQMPIPPQSTTFTGNVRGYWFTAPSCFTITGLQIPTDAGTGSQNIAVMRLPAPPPIFSATTNVFTTLFLTQNNPATGIIPVNIQVETGDHIMILGQRATANSYSATTAYTSNINGQSMVLYRAGMQFNLTTTAPQQLWSQTSSQISRVWMYYDSVLTFNVTATPSGPSSFTFTDGSDSSFTTVWNYGDGSPLDNNWNGSHTYSSGGTYNVCSYVTTSCGTDTVCTTVTICGASPVSAFSSAPTGFNVAFSDNSTNAASWLWDFGDGNTSTSQNPAHTYSSSGTYTVCLIATNSCAVSDTICNSVLVCGPDPTSAFSSAPSGFNVAFSDNSTNATSWLWDFGDGNTSTSQNPTHTYSSLGTYTVCLITTNSCAVADTICNSVLVCISPSAAMSLQRIGTDTVVFSDNSTNATSWLWDFGDGNTDNTQNPTHIYTADGDYTICLMVMNACGADTICDTITVCVTPLTAAFSSTTTLFDVSLTNSSTGATTYAWDFGDGNTSTAQSPTHTYAQNGTYTVCLTTSNNCFQSVTSCDTVLIDVVGVTQSLPGFDISVAPNPMGDVTILLVQHSNLQGSYSLELMDLAGAVVKKAQGQFNAPLALRRDGLARGLYIFRIVQEDLPIGTGRLMVE